MAHRGKVMIVVPSSTYSREILKGIHAYCQEHPSWQLYMFMLEQVPVPTENRRLARFIHYCRPDAIVAALRPSIYKLLQKVRLPLVNISAVMKTSLPTVVADHLEIGRLAARHLLDRNLKNFAYGCVSKGYFAQLRGQGFRQELQAAGMTCDIFEERLHKSYADQMVPETDLRQWLARLERPLGVFMSYDQLALEMVWTCQSMGLEVPSDVAILGADNDEQMCASWTPSITSVDVGTWRIGHEAMAVLERLLAGEKPPEQPLLIAPIGVAARQSTDILATQDTQVLAALRFIRDNAHRSIDVKDVLTQVSISRRALERRFTKLVGRSLHDEILRVRLDKAKSLLSGSDLPIADVAKNSGFASHMTFSAVFRQEMDMTPTQYRRDFRKR